MYSQRHLKTVGFTPPTPSWKNARNGAGIILFKQTVMDIESLSGALSFPNLHCQYIYHEAVYLMLHFIQLD